MEWPPLPRLRRDRLVTRRIYGGPWGAVVRVCFRSYSVDAPVGQTFGRCFTEVRDRAQSSKDAGHVLACPSSLPSAGNLGDIAPDGGSAPYC